MCVHGRSLSRCTLVSDGKRRAREARTVERRRVLAGLAAMPLVRALGGRLTVSPDEAAATVAELDTRATLSPTRATLRAVIEAYDDVELALSDRASRDLSRAAAQLAILGGIVEADTGQPQWSWRWFAAARGHASDAGDPHTLAWSYAREGGVARVYPGYPHRPHELAHRGMAALPARDRFRAGVAAVLLTRRRAPKVSLRAMRWRSPTAPRASPHRRVGRPTWVSRPPNAPRPPAASTHGWGDSRTCWTGSGRP